MQTGFINQWRRLCKDDTETVVQATIVCHSVANVTIIEAHHQPSTVQSYIYIYIKCKSNQPEQTSPTKEILLVSSAEIFFLSFFLSFFFNNFWLLLFVCENDRGQWKQPNESEPLEENSPSKLATLWGRYWGGLEASRLINESKRWQSYVPGIMATVFRARNTRNVRSAAKLPKSIPIVTYLTQGTRCPISIDVFKSCLSHHLIHFLLTPSPLPPSRPISF